MSKVNVDTLSTQDESEEVPVSTVINGSAKAWVNFDGTGTPSIRASFNVSGIVDNGTGDYTVVFEEAFSDANYAVFGFSGLNGPLTQFSSSAVNSVSLRTQQAGGGVIDSSNVHISIFR